MALGLAVVLAGFGFLLLNSAGSVAGRVHKILGDVRWEEFQSNRWQAGFVRRTVAGVRDLFGRFLGGRQSQGEYYHQEQLVKLGTNAVPELLHALSRDSSLAVRRVAARSLGELPAPGVLEGLTNALLADQQSEVRDAVCSALGGLGDANAIPALLVCLRADGEAGVRAEAAGALGALGGPELVPELIAAGRRETNHLVQIRIAGTLGGLPDARSVPLLVQWLNTQSKPFEPPTNVSWKMGYIDLDYTGSNGEGVVSAAARALGNIGGEVSFMALQARWPGETNNEVRGALCEALGAIGDARALPTLLAALREEGELRSSVIDALGNLGNTNAIPDLLPLLEDADKEIRQRTATALGVIGGDAGAAELMRVVKEDSAEEVRAQACGALGAIGCTRAQQVIIEAVPQLRDHRQEAAWALGHVGDTNAIPALVEMLGDTDNQTRFAAAYALAEIGGPAAAAVLATHLSDRDEYARHGKACALAMLGATNSLPGVRDGLSAKEDWRRFGAALALIRLGQEVTAAEWAPMQADTSKAFQELANECVAGRALPAVTGLLRHRNNDLRHYAARGLVFFHEPSTLPALREACRDPNPEVRQAAQVSVRCIERRVAER